MFKNNCQNLKVRIEVLPKTQQSKTRHHYVPVFCMKMVFDFDSEKDLSSFR